MSLHRKRQRTRKNSFMGDSERDVPRFSIDDTVDAIPIF